MLQSSYFSVANWLKATLFFLLLFLIWQANAQPARAAILEVCQTGACFYNDLQTAIDEAGNGDTITFPVNRETYGAINVNDKELTFEGNNTEIDAAGLETAVTITGSTVTFSNFTIQNGNGSSGAGILLNSGNLSLTNVSFDNNNATNGGALYVASSGMVQLTDVTMRLNYATNSGGAIYNNGTIIAEGLTLTDNTANNGAGIYNTSSATVENLSALQRNTAIQAGGAVFNAASGNFTLNSSDVSNNDATEGAAVYNEGELQLTNTNLGSGNTATLAGGGLFNSGQATLLNSAVFQNDAPTGAGIFNEETLIATNTTLSRNEGAIGAGLVNDSGTATLNSVTIHLTIGSSVVANGGAIMVGNSIISSVSGQTACGGDANLITSNGYNLASDQSCTFLTADGDLQGINPNLNGIFSPSGIAAYHSPKLTSPAVDAGSPEPVGSSSTACLSTDARGLARPQSARCDIGAVEIVIYRLFVPMVTK